MTTCYRLSKFYWMNSYLSNKQANKDMPPEGYRNLTVHEDVLTLLTEVGAKYECKSYPDAAETAALVALERDSADLARILADQLEK